VIPGAIGDTAGSVTGGSTNRLDVTDPRNALRFTVGSTLTVTLGASGDETIRIAVDDAGVAGPDRPDVGHDSGWLSTQAAGLTAKGFVHFDWESAFEDATGVTDSSAIVDASFSVESDWGVGQVVAARKALKPWTDAHAGDDATDPAGGPTWTYASWPSVAWNIPGASAYGGDGLTASDYGGAFDVTAAPDAVAEVSEIGARAVFGGPAILAAYRFWYAAPQLDHGHALEQASPGAPELKLRSAEASLGQHGPVLTITYALPPAPEPLPEVSAPESGSPLLVARAGGEVSLDFQSVGAARYEVLEGAIGDWYSHVSAGCREDGVVAGGRVTLEHPAATGSRYFLVGADGPCGSWLGSSSSAATRPLSVGGCR
jgi:hypothetical protein